MRIRTAFTGYSAGAGKTQPLSLVADALCDYPAGTAVLLPTNTKTNIKIITKANLNPNHRIQPRHSCCGREIPHNHPQKAHTDARLASSPRLIRIPTLTPAKMRGRASGELPPRKISVERRQNFRMDFESRLSLRVHTFASTPAALL